MDIKEYLNKDPSISSGWYLILHAGFHTILLYRISRFLYELRLKPLAYIVYFLNRVVYSSDIHPAAQIEPGVVIDHAIGTVIGSTAKVGSGTLIYHGVTLGAREITSGKRHPDIGRNVIIGAGAKILGPIRVGDNAKIGANAVVLDDVPPDATAVGIPARIIKRT